MRLLKETSSSQDWKNSNSTLRGQFEY